ncbi:hypothetical protein [Lewinella sp. W8]|uniref:hypothetical protein n=1 Tax=Lewinella sp. W8 TaxID=2528208 RepID=UPI001068CADC|nr:hypothetical protein [Lewinella sp. W8]MTB49410.1 hypothetical protein [Lewinella sp. W8]
MTFVKSLLRIARKSSASSRSGVPDGLCPNCWGRAEYGGQFYDAVRNRGLDANHKDEDVGWVQDYATKHLTGIVLHRSEGQLLCRKCKVTYRPS